ncbi:DoxX family protein [Nocardia sp. NPDC052254]|uniref:DoxX family protein n=1 Tax=Nocardia sp. NPDC052254 TaxID=3155681 RepID=UPI00343497D4
MQTTYITVTIIAAVAAGAAALVDFVAADWVRGNMRNYGIPDWALIPLGVIKLAGAIGLLAGLVFPPIGVAAAICLFLYFIGAVATVLRARCYADLPYPMPFLALALAAVCVLPAA